MTLLRVAAGFLLGMAAGTALGVLTAASKAADAFFAPLRGVVKATPVTSFIILVLLWLTASLTPVFIAFLMVLPIAWANVREGVLAVDAQLLEMAEVFQLPRAKSCAISISLPCFRNTLRPARQALALHGKAVWRQRSSRGRHFPSARIYMKASCI